MQMYFYAFLNEFGICHTIIESDEEKTDISGSCVSIDSYDDSYLNSRWTGSEWINPPSPYHTWNGSEWKVTTPPSVDYAYDGTEWVHKDILGPLPETE
jgi:hypothetical protein